jgi:BirA family biotin operon repressor/biotin-[acetyl-CoA-carboxylase] ligase
MSRDEILGLLEQGRGRHVSGADLSRTLGVSRSAVWKQIEALRAQGYSISGGPRQGYILEGRPDLLYPREIRRGLRTHSFGGRIYHLRCAGSTNQVAQDLARRGCPEGTLVVAEEQTAGRGRWQRSWYSPPRQGIWMSLVLRPPLAPHLVPQITMVAGVSCARAIHEHLGLRPGIKWPNDIVCDDGRKLCGILVEMEASAEQVHFLVAGIGVNVNQELADFPPDLRDTAASLRMITGGRVERLPLTRCLLEMFEEDYERYCREGFATARKQWLDYQATLGRMVRVRGAEEFTGEACGLDEDGCLLVRSEGGQIRRSIAGEILEVRG